LYDERCDLDRMFCSILAHFLPKFSCHGNSLGSLEILDSIFEITDPENATIHAKFVLISCTGMKLCLFECLAIFWHIFTIADIGNFLDFCEKKIVEIVKKF